MERISSYGVVGVGEAKGGMFKITHMVEKPPRDKAPSNLSITGRYILQPEIFTILASQSRGTGGEIQLTDAMITLAKSQDFYGLKFKGESFDCGSKIGFLTANVAYALDRPNLAPALRAEIKRLMGG
jgi:UTP--glucose-1-phosphate uridylyltransferase